MDFIITPHAQYRLEERGISIEKIKETIRRPQRVAIQNDNSIKAIGKNITVVYKKNRNSYVIITAYGN